MEIVSDFLSFFLSVIGAYFLYIPITGHPLPESIWFYVRLGSIGGLAAVVVFHFVGLYRHQASMMNLLETKKLIHTVLWLFLILIVYSFFTKAPYSRIILSLALGLLLMLLLTCRFIFFKIHQKLFLRGIGIHNLLIFGSGQAARLLFQSISHTPKLGYLPFGFYEPEKHKRRDLAKFLQLQNQSQKICILTSFDECIQLLQSGNIQDIIISKPLFSEEQQTRHLLDICEKYNIAFHSIPYAKALFTEQVLLEDINGIPLVSFRNLRLRLVERIEKRCFDLFFGTIILCLSAPIMAVIAFLIKQDSTGEVLFKQQRIGLHGVPFTMYKFRSMFADTDDYQNSPSQQTDSRITGVGRWLRKTSLDELPQIFNVLQGNMSLVGPRPEMEFIVNNEYNDLYKQRFQVKPGITGIWQISTDRTREIHEDISYDLFYIANRSLLLDILLLIRTIPALFIMRTN